MLASHVGKALVVGEHAGQIRLRSRKLSPQFAGSALQRGYLCFQFGDAVNLPLTVRSLPLSDG